MAVGQRRGSFCEAPTYEAVGDRVHVVRMAPNVLELSCERSEAGGNWARRATSPPALISAGLRRRKTGAAAGP